MLHLSLFKYLRYHILLIFALLLQHKFYLSQQIPDGPSFRIRIYTTHFRLSVLTRPKQTKPKQTNRFVLLGAFHEQGPFPLVQSANLVRFVQCKSRTGKNGSVRFEILKRRVRRSNFIRSIGSGQNPSGVVKIHQEYQEW